MSSRWTFWCLIWLFISYGGLPTESWRTRGAPQTEASAYARQDTPARSNRWGGLGQTRWCAGCHTGAAKAPLFLPTAGSGGSHQGTQHVVAVSTLLAVGEGHCGFLPTVRNWPPELCGTGQGPWHALGGDWTGSRCRQRPLVGWAPTEIPASQVAEVSWQGWRQQPRQGSEQDKRPEGLQGQRGPCRDDAGANDPSPAWGTGGCQCAGPQASIRRVNGQQLVREPAPTRGVGTPGHPQRCSCGPCATGWTACRRVAQSSGKGLAQGRGPPAGGQARTFPSPARSACVRERLGTILGAVDAIAGKAAAGATGGTRQVRCRRSSVEGSARGGVHGTLQTSGRACAQGVRGECSGDLRGRDGHPGEADQRGHRRGGQGTADSAAARAEGCSVAGGHAADEECAAGQSKAARPAMAPGPRADLHPRSARMRPKVEAIPRPRKLPSLQRQLPLARPAHEPLWSVRAERQPGFRSGRTWAGTSFSMLRGGFCP